MRIGYLDCFSGVAGDMFVAALLDAGLDVAALRDELAKLGVPGFRIEAERTWRDTLHGTHVRVIVEDEAPPHRGLSEIKAILAGSALDPHVKERATQVFTRLAAAEAKVHGATLDDVHFHEVGAIDAIADVVGAVAGLRLLGIDELHVSPVTVGRGFARGEHGTMPVPVPASIQLLEGFPVVFSDLDGELVTPTGAALVATLATRRGAGFSMVPRAVGYGFGTRERPGGPPNAVRLIVGESPEQGEELVLLETNLDDVTGQVVGFLIDRCLDGGALDAWAAPIQMKKSRPGILFSALADEARAGAVEALLFSETPTLGVRRRRVQRAHLERRVETVHTTLGAVRVKFARGPEGTPRAAPEYDDVARIAVERGLPFHRALAAIQRELPPWPAEPRAGRDAPERSGEGAPRTG